MLLAAAFVLGALSSLSLPPLGWWPVAPVVIGCAWSFALRLSTSFGARRGPRLNWRRAGVLLLTFWLGAYTFGLYWVAELTLPGWLVAVVVEAVIMTAAGLAAFAASRAARRGERVGVLAGAAALVLGEFIRGEVPFGGVPLSSLSLAAVNAPWLSAARVGSAMLLVAITGAIAATVSVLLGAWADRRGGAVAPNRSLAPSRRRRQRAGSRRAWLAAPVAVAAVVGLVWLAPDGRGELPRQVRAAAIQVGGPLGTQGSSSAAFTQHVELMRNSAAALSDADVVLWSESSASSDGALETSAHMAELLLLAEEFDTTVVANFYERTTEPASAGGRFRNASVAVWSPSLAGATAAPVEPAEATATPSGGQLAVTVDGRAGGRFARHDKVHLVPFGEYVPLRWLVEWFADLSLIDREAIAGSGPGLLDAPQLPLAVATSYEIYFPYVVNAAVRAGGQLVVNPTLASTYSTGTVAAQSLASARLRAVETGRWVLQASTTGYTAIVNPSGEVAGRSELGDPVVMVGTVELRSGTTWAVRWGSWWLGWAAALFAAGGACVQAVRPRYA